MTLFRHLLAIFLLLLAAVSTAAAAAFSEGSCCWLSSLPSARCRRLSTRRMRNEETATSKIIITGSRLGASSSSSLASILSTNIINSEQSSPPPPAPPPPPPQPDIGLYRLFAELAWTMLTSSSTKFQQPLSLEPAPDVPESLRHQMAVAKGPQGGSSSSSSSVRRVVHMETRALQAKKDSSSCPIQYARFALLETIPQQQQQQQEQKQPDGSSSEAVNNNNGNLDITAVAAAAPTAGAANSRVTVHTSGIQVLNLVIFPNPSTTNNNKKNRRPLPVWGADFVSLPGNKHLLLLDAQPMRADCTHYRHWDAWHAKHNIGSHDNDSSSSLSSSFPWGGDLPPAVQKFVSPRTLWTRMGAAAAAAAAPAADGASIPQQQDPVELIQGQLLEVFQEHLQLYLDLLLQHDKEDDDGGGGENDQESDSKDNNNDINVNWSREYLQYRLDNDPARPMLKSLYGEEWTEQVLNTVLFPMSKLVAEKRN